LTDLPGEVYVPSYWAQFAATRFYTRSRGPKPERLSIQPHRARGYIYAADGEEMLASTKTGEILTVDVGPAGAIVEMECRYVRVHKPLPLSVRPGRWFAPDGSKLKLRP